MKKLGHKVKLGKKVIKHLKGDIKGYRKEQKHLDEEIQEDKKLMRAARKS